MRQIEIDDEVYACLESRVRGFNDSPNLVLRRVFRIDHQLGEKNTKQSIVRSQPNGSKAPKTDLRRLIDSGMLKENQELELRDYKGNPQGIRARVRGNQLEYNGQVLSLSALTRRLMQKRGYQSNSYRGPQFWFTSDGVSIREVWEMWLAKHSS